MLIDLEKLNTKKKTDKAAAHHDKALRYISEKISAEMKEQLGALRMGEAVHYSTGAKWSLHDLVVNCIQQTGPADVYLCFYAVKEYQARLLANMQRDGLIRDIHTLLYYRAGVNDAGAVQLLTSVSKTFGTMRTHAKLVVIRNENWGVTIIGSANLTTNTQADVGVITCNTAIADYWINWIKSNINDGTK